jgi:hypothetical protein
MPVVCTGRTEERQEDGALLRRFTFTEPPSRPVPSKIDLTVECFDVSTDYVVGREYALDLCRPRTRHRTTVAQTFNSRTHHTRTHHTPDAPEPDGGEQA